MSFVAVTFLFPAVVGVLALGAGLVVERLSGARLPTPALPALGFGLLLIVSQFTVLSPAIAPLTPWFLILVAIVGFVVGRAALRDRWRSPAGSRWPLLVVPVASYCTVAAPLVLAGTVTFPGYLLDTTAGFHLAAGEYMLHHGASLPHPYPAYGEMLNAYYGRGYPSGGQVLLAATGWLTGQDLLWLYFPFQAASLGFTALLLTFMAESAGLPRRAAVVAGWIAAVPALVTAYAQMGSIKEITALPELMAMGAMIVLAPRLRQVGLRGVIPFGVAAAGAIAAIGPSAAGWIVVLAACALGAVVLSLPATRSFARSRRRGSAVALARDGLTHVSAAGAAAVIVVLLLAIPTLTRLGASLSTATSLSGSDVALANDPGNLLRPLRFVQAFGVWLGGSHRVDPRYVTQTYLLIGVVFVCFGLGAMWLVRRRSWSVLTWLAASLLVWLLLYERGTEWTDAKVMMLTSPVIVLIAMIGAFGELRRHRVQGVVLAAVLAGGVLVSDGLLYHYASMAPTARFQELTYVGEKFAGDGPTLLPDFDEYTFFVLRKLDVDSPGFGGVMRRPFLLYSGPPLYGHSYDIDEIKAPFVQEFSQIVMRRSPLWSRPPGNFRLVWAGRYYEVWRRTGPAPRAHVPAGSARPTGPVSCRQVRSLSRQALADHAELRYAIRPPLISVNLAKSVDSPDVGLGSDGEGHAELGFAGPGKAVAPAQVAHAGRYQLWMGGDVDRPLSVRVDGRLVGAPSQQRGGDGNMIDVASVTLPPGKHLITFTRPGASLKPGDDGGTSVDGVYLQAGSVEDEQVRTTAPGQWKSLCGRHLDWLEVT